MSPRGAVSKLLGQGVNPQCLEFDESQPWAKNVRLLMAILRDPEHVMATGTTELCRKHGVPILAIEQTVQSQQEVTEEQITENFNPDGTIRNRTFHQRTEKKIEIKTMKQILIAAPGDIPSGYGGSVGSIDDPGEPGRGHGHGQGQGPAWRETSRTESRTEEHVVEEEGGGGGGRFIQAGLPGPEVPGGVEAHGVTSPIT